MPLGFTMSLCGRTLLQGKERWVWWGGAALPHSPWQSRSLTSDIAVQRKETCLFLLGSQKERLDLVGRWGLEEEMVPPVSLTCSLAQWGLYPFSC